jgi:hypothetical protein
MKTPEDEAFDEIARKQGHWGGGFQAKQAMAADKLQEPVAWNKQIRDSVDSLLEQAGYQPDSSARNALSMINFDAPPKREWIGLTDEERESIAQDYSLTGLGYQSPFKAIEAMLKEKNT